MADNEGPEYVPGARVLVGALRKAGTVQRSFEMNGHWNYYVEMDQDGRGITCSGAILHLGTLPQRASR